MTESDYDKLARLQAALLAGARPCRFMVTRREEEGDDEEGWQESDHPPCEGAVWQQYLRVERRTTDDPAKILAAPRDSSWWTALGADHRVEEGWIARDVTDHAWFVTLDNWPQLVQLLSRFGMLHLTMSDSKAGEPLLSLGRN